MLKSEAKISGELRILLTGEDGEVKLDQTMANLITTAGKTHIGSRMGGASASVMSHMAVGTGNTAAAAGDTTLGTESARVALDSATPGAAQIVYVATFPAGTGTAALTEAGVLNAGSSGTLLCRTVFSAINKGASDSLTITWTITIS